MWPLWGALCLFIMEVLLSELWLRVHLPTDAAESKLLFSALCGHLLVQSCKPPHTTLLGCAAPG